MKMFKMSPYNAYMAPIYLKISIIDRTYNDIHSKTIIEDRIT